MEYILLSRLEGYILTGHAQFGFKRKLGTDMCIFALKEILNKYISLESNMFVVFLDASKAFDRVNHSKLFHKLVKCKVPGYIIRILIYWYDNQTMCVRWGRSINISIFQSNKWGKTMGDIVSSTLQFLYGGIVSKP